MVKKKTEAASNYDPSFFCYYSLFFTRFEDTKFDSDFPLYELEVAIKSLELKSAPGSDNIRYINIINLSTLGKIHCLRIFNKSWKTGQL